VSYRIHVYGCLIECEKAQEVIDIVHVVNRDDLELIANRARLKVKDELLEKADAELDRWRRALQTIRAGVENAATIAAEALDGSSGLTIAERDELDQIP
jgi:hypothetical protein